MTEFRRRQSRCRLSCDLSAECGEVLAVSMYREKESRQLRRSWEICSVEVDEPEKRSGRNRLLFDFSFYDSRYTCLGSSTGVTGLDSAAENLGGLNKPRRTRETVGRLQ